MHRLGVIIINYKTAGLVIDCLFSLVNELDRKEDKIIIIDNNSNDGSVEVIEEEVAKNAWADVVTVVQSPQNGGFSAGNNIGIQAVDAEYYFLLNSDTIVLTGAVKILISVLNTNPEIGIIGPRIEDDKTEAQVSSFHFATPFREFLKSAGIGLISRFLRMFNIHEMPIHRFERAFEPDWIGFPAVILRKQVLDQVGLMDEGYFMYFEDIDYCRRVRQNGWSIRYEPQARIAHLNLGASNFKTRRLPGYYYRSRSRYYAKHFGKHGLFAANLFWCMGRLISLTRELINAKPPQLPEHAWKDIWIGFFSPMRSKAKR